MNERIVLIQGPGGVVVSAPQQQATDIVSHKDSDWKLLPIDKATGVELHEYHVDRLSPEDRSRFFAGAGNRITLQGEKTEHPVDAMSPMDRAKFFASGGVRE